MNTPNNARSARSKQKLKRAFIKLLESKNFTDITVGEICKEAEVNRTTFYSHYANVSELYNALELDLHHFMKSALLSPKIGTSDDNAIEMICSVLALVKEHKNIHLNYIDKLFELDYVVDLCESVREKYMPMMLDGVDLPPTIANYFFVFCRNGIVGIIRDWLKNDCKDDLLLVAESILFIMHQFKLRAN